MVRLVKDVVERSLAAMVLIVASPIVVLAAIAILLDDGAPIFFRQTRPGLMGRPFVVVKFRTMNNDRDIGGNLLPDEVRLMKIGRILRRFSIDELPQFWNVFRGEMSIIGPRPLLLEYLERYTPEQARRHTVKPGITGWAQVHGRQDLPFSRRLELDLWYIDHRDFWLDLRIIFMTVKVLCGTGVRSGQDVREVDDLGLHPDSRQEKDE